MVAQLDKKASIALSMIIRADQSQLERTRSRSQTKAIATTRDALAASPVTCSKHHMAGYVLSSSFLLASNLA